MEKIENRMVVDSEWESHYKAVATCCECDGLIYEGDYFFSFDGDDVCVNCEPGYVKEHFRRCIE